MLIVEYKILFELRILHDYYLINRKGDSVFPMERKDWEGLQKKLRFGHYDISKDIDFILSREEHKKFQNYRLKMVRTPLGFYVGIEVKTETHDNGDRRYRPFIKPHEDAVLVFGLKPLNSLFGNITNISLSRNDNKIYHFSNRGKRVENTLSSPVPAITDGQFYQMGDLGTAEDGSIRLALEDNTGDNSKWSAKPLYGSGFVHQADRTLSTGEKWYKSWLLDFDKPARNPFGMIRIYFRTGTPAMDLIDDEGYLVTRRAAGQVRPAHPVFELRFQSRPTYWRYYKKEGYKAADVEKIERDLSEVLEKLETVNDGEREVKFFVTKSPRYFSEALTSFETSVPAGSNGGENNGVNSPLTAAGETPRHTRFIYFTNARPDLLQKEQGRMFCDIHFTQANPIPL